MNPNVRRYEYSRLCEDFDSPRVYPVYDSHKSFVEVARFATEKAAQSVCDSLNTKAVEEAYLKPSSTGSETKPAYVASAFIATAESDAKLRDEYVCKGQDAFKAGEKLEDCPVDGMLKGWWQEGWQRAQSRVDVPQSWPL